MKSTYHLIGTFLDQREECTEEPPFATYDDRYLEFGFPYCLFDMDGLHRYIPLSTLLSLKTQDEYNEIVQQITECSAIAIIDDCSSESDGLAQKRFIQQRRSQAIRLLRDDLPTIPIYSMRNPRDEEMS